MFGGRDQIHLLHTVSRNIRRIAAVANGARSCPGRPERSAFFPQMIPQTWCDRSTFEFYWTPKTKAVWLEVKIDHNNRPEGPKSTEKGTLPRRRQQGFIHSTYFDSTPSQTIKSTHLIPGSTQSSSHGFHPGRSWLLMSLAPLIGSAAQDGESRRPDPAGR